MCHQSWSFCRDDAVDTNVLVLEPKVKKPAADAGPDPAAAPAKKLSKSQKRKLKKVQEDKAKRAERAEVRLKLLKYAVVSAVMRVKHFDARKRRGSNKCQAAWSRRWSFGKTMIVSARLISEVPKPCRC